MPGKRRPLYFAVAAGALSAGFLWIASNDRGQVEIPFDVVAQGKNGLDRNVVAALVFRSWGEWESYWRKYCGIYKHNHGEVKQRPAPGKETSFNTHQLVAIHFGRFRNGGRTQEVPSVRLRVGTEDSSGGNQLILVECLQGLPEQSGQTTSALEFPYLVIRVPKSDAEFKIVDSSGRTIESP